MSFSSKLRTLSACITNLLRNPVECVRKLAGSQEELRGVNFARRVFEASDSEPIEPRSAARYEENSRNPLLAYFEDLKEGPGVWKWLHYFELYHRHLQKFVGRPVHVVEVGVFSGGSMSMWRRYFGEECRVHGIDIEAACKVYENSHTTIHIGDQADRAFWRRFKAEVPAVDVLIDDGGHLFEQQIVTLEEMLPHIRPGGVYICEDIYRIGNACAKFAQPLVSELNAFAAVPQQELASALTTYQAAIASIHFYPFVMVIEKRDTKLTSFSAPRRGTEWQPPTWLAPR